MSGGNGKNGNRLARRPKVARDHHVRESLQIIQQAVRNNWKIPQKWIDELPRIAAEIALKGKGERERLRALEVLRAMVRDRVDAAVILDKIERLEGGEPTERVEYVAEFDRMG